MTSAMSPKWSKRSTVTNAIVAPPLRPIGSSRYSEEDKWFFYFAHLLNVGIKAYLVHNRYLIPNDGERYRNGQAIATGFVESTVNEVVSKRFCKKQQMQWSKEGAHLLLQTRVRTLNGELGAIFKRWYPDMDLEVEEIPVAA